MWTQMNWEGTNKNLNHFLKKHRLMSCLLPDEPP
jgi:hypothetical protein